ncbi:MAG: hypothetical protein IPL65_10695 [Lewinellaceae bacterium]|nr:hypothetical protein [Lewinellaceae bacterium]
MDVLPSSCGRAGADHQWGIKAIIGQFVLVSAPLIVVWALWSGGLSVIPDLLLAYANLVLFSYVISLVVLRQLPFSQPAAPGQGDGCVLTALAMGGAGIMGAIHYFLFNMYYFIVPALMVVVAVNLLLARSIRTMGWDRIGPVQE